MDSRAQTVEIDHDKLCRYIRDTLHMTLIDFSYSIGKSKSYISGLARNPKVPGAAYSLICEKCRVPFSYFEAAPQEERQKSQEQTSVNPELLLMLKSLSDSMIAMEKRLSAMGGEVSKVLQKCSANTLQLERVRDALEKLSMSDYDRAETYLKASLADGDRIASDILANAEAEGIKTAELMKAKNRMGIRAYTTGYGKSQKKWWGYEKGGIK
ncbi:hypothetical protein [Blautia sp.]|uniref:hypothetical protein n=1 Tax=Blautia sp. TaxID=1955243 RepID=UPI003AB697BE